MMEDALEVQSMGTQFLSYNTKHTVEEVVQFYKDEMAALGYSVGSEIVLAGNAVLEFRKDGQVVGLAVTPASDGENMVVVTGQ